VYADPSGLLLEADQAPGVHAKDARRTQLIYRARDLLREPVAVDVPVGTDMP
jgi:hypothetical protein